MRQASVDSCLVMEEFFWKFKKIEREFGVGS